MARTSLTGDDHNKVVAWYQHGDSIRIIAARLGVSYGQIHRILTTNNVTLRGRGGANRGR